MKSMFLSLFSVSICACIFGAAPEKLDGFIYYEHGEKGGFAAFEESASVFSPDGTFTQLFYRYSLGDRQVIRATLGEPTSGSYSYRKIDDKTAEMSFTNSGFNHSGQLRFDSASTETGMFFDPSYDPNESYSGPVRVGRRTFRLVPFSTRSPLANCSNRSFVRSGDSSLAGFVIAGDRGNPTAQWKMVLVRAVGPGLAQFGITDFLRDPVLSVLGADNDDWGTVGANSIRRISSAVGAFPLPEGSKDAFILVNAPPGAWVAKASSKDASDSGQVLIEVYMLP